MRKRLDSRRGVPKWPTGILRSVVSVPGPMLISRGRPGPSNTSTMKV